MTPPDNTGGDENEVTQKNLRFTTSNNRSSTYELPVTLKLTDTTENAREWSIYDNGELIADHKGYLSDGMRIEYEGRHSGIGYHKNPLIYFERAVTGVRDIELFWYAATSTVLAFDVPVEDDVSTAHGTVVVKEYSDAVYSHQFNLENINLTVPEYLLSNMTSTSQMFANSTLFNQDLSMLDTSNVSSMYAMFEKTNYNQDISMWDVSANENFAMMFANNPVFNQPIGVWNVSAGWEFYYMLQNATAFNQDLSQFCTTRIDGWTPNGFSEGATAYTLPKPIWGTCSRGEVPSESTYPDPLPPPPSTMCVIEPSAWSNPISLADIAHDAVLTGTNYVGVDLEINGSPNYAVDMSTVTSIEDFFDKLIAEATGQPYKIAVQNHDATSVLIRFERNENYNAVITVTEAHKPRYYIFQKRGQFYEYDEAAAGTNGASTICLADKFDMQPVFVDCKL